ncbi:MAG: leucine--tRNA ligase [Candidatus Shapirobacteria bacterium]|nr:leucine--tRNA ligase [Candidatus Shapirobacteria bacterium]MDD3002655.1 leucine--tRNA ligase [Candidatus Shapirobacteria bacterium]MDD4382836.1 leucine--tRNA ligase [Candidatus Shapirobacteria bacterium]
MENFREIENKWGKFWEEHSELYQADNDSEKNKKYILVEFPYPSGSGLHVGHAFSFTGGDVYARFKRMQGENVLFPMGWDAFGLPTENYAIKMKRKPQEVTKENTDMFRKQMKDLAFSFDWSREVNTTDPSYYKWTQWIFIQLFNKGLAYKKEMPINWCPSCKIGLANEEVVDGKCERCGSEVSRRNISQWVVRITEYADKLIEGLEKTNFIEKVKQAQINWIGKSEGAKIKFKVKSLSSSSSSRDAMHGVSTDYLEVFTTRPDTLFGATFMVIAPEHELALEMAKNNEEIKKYISETRKKSDLERTELSKDKTGVFSRLYAINPANGKEIPIWISDFVLASYGTGAIMSVPAHDERDEEFAKKFGLEIISVYDEKNNKVLNSEFLNGLNKKEAIKKMIEWISEKGIGEKTSSYHLRDWIFSRQHYWGEPIPMVNCPECGWVPVSEEQLPIVLPEVGAYEPTDDGKSPLSKIESFVKTKCPKCGGEAERETDTMPNWAGSDWYFLRYIDPHNDTVLASQELMKYWCPVDVYIGGDEHNVLHLLYSRFIYKFLWDLGVVPKEQPEPYYKRLSHGVILGPDNQRMSKSKGNVIVPEVVADKYGVDVVRMYMMFMGPFDSTMAWNENTLMGVKRFLDRFEQFIKLQINQTESETAKNREIKVILNKTIKNITEMNEQFKYNTAIAQMMELLNSLSGYKIGVEDTKTLVKLIAPFAPYIAEELWYKLENEGSVHVAEWPKTDPQYLIEEEVMIMIAINGKTRSELKIETDKIDNKDLILDLVKKDEKIIKWIGTNDIVKEIYIPGKMVNLVVKL